MIPSSSKNSDRIINELGGIGNSMSGHRFQSEGWSFAMDSRVRGQALSSPKIRLRAFFDRGQEAKLSFALLIRMYGIVLEKRSTISVRQ